MLTEEELKKSREETRKKRAKKRLDYLEEYRKDKLCDEADCNKYRQRELDIEFSAERRRNCDLDDVYKTREENTKNKNLIRKYGINLKQWNSMRDEQNCCCGICGKNELELIKSLAVDHNHETGKIRMLLCGACNLGLGSFKENPELLQKAIEYLNKFNEDK